MNNFKDINVDSDIGNYDECHIVLKNTKILSSLCF